MPRTGQPVVLVVEDDWLVRDFIVSHLRGAGWRTLETDSAEQAIAMLNARQQIDILVTDIQLRGELTGWDVAEAFRAAQPTMPVIYVSGNVPGPHGWCRRACSSASLRSGGHPTILPGLRVGSRRWR